MSDVYHSIWGIIDVIHICTKLEIKFPKCHENRSKWPENSNLNQPWGLIIVWGILMAYSFGQVILVLFAYLEPNLDARFFSLVEKIGLNMQAICDSKHRVLDIDIAHPDSTPDYLAFGPSPICTLLKTKGFLSPGLTIYGDNAYMNTLYMASPFKSISSGVKDAYNFYHSQVRINIKCAFGMSINRWEVIRTPIPINVSIKKQHLWYVLYAVFILG